jgi:glucose-1-phosphate adenylyltransferase
VEFKEKPVGAELDQMQVDTTMLGLSPAEAAARPFLASMGIYVFRKEVLRHLLLEVLKTAVDFGREILPASLVHNNVQAYLFDGYWEDIGTIAAFYRANLEMTLPLPPFNFFDAEAPIYSRPRYLPGSKLVDCCIKGSIVCDGCILDGATIVNSVVGIRSRIGLGTQVNGVLMMGADFYQTTQDIRDDTALEKPSVGIGQHCVIRSAIIDKNARIGSNVHIVNEAGHSEVDGEGYYIRSGIVVIPKEGIIPNGTVI